MNKRKKKKKLKKKKEEHGHWYKTTAQEMFKKIRKGKKNEM